MWNKNEFPEKGNYLSEEINFFLFLFRVIVLGLLRSTSQDPQFLFQLSFIFSENQYLTSLIKKNFGMYYLS